MQRWLAVFFSTALATTAFAQPDMDEDEMDDEMIEMTRTTGRALLGVDLVLAKVRGDYGDFIGLGIGGDVWAGYEIPVGDVGLIPRFKVGYENLLAKDGNSGGLLTVYPGFLVSYHAGNVTPWFGIGLGVASIKDDDKILTAGESRQNKFGFEIGAGLTYSVSPSTSVGAFLNYDIVATEGESMGIVMFGLGPVFAF